MLSIDPETLSRKERYELLIQAVTPRPIGFISTVSGEGRTNIAPYSFFNAVAAEPMTLLFCPVTGRDGRDKDSLRNAYPPKQPQDSAAVEFSGQGGRGISGGTGCFVANIVLNHHAQAVADAGQDWETSEFEALGLEAAPSRCVAAPRLSGAPAAFECETLEIVRLGDGAAGTGNIVIGKVVHIWLDPEHFDAKGRLINGVLPALARLGGNLYCQVQAPFSTPISKLPSKQ